MFCPTAHSRCSIYPALPYSLSLKTGGDASCASQLLLPATKITERSDVARKKVYFSPRFGGSQSASVWCRMRAGRAGKEEHVASWKHTCASPPDLITGATPAS